MRGLDQFTDRLYTGYVPSAEVRALLTDVYSTLPVFIQRVSWETKEPSGD